MLDLTAHECMDIGARATQEAKAENTMNTEKTRVFFCNVHYVLPVFFVCSVVKGPLSCRHQGVAH